EYPITGTETGGGALHAGGEQVSSERVHGNANGRVADDRRGHGRDRFPPDGSHADPERQREEHVRGGDDSLYVEPSASEPVADHGDERSEGPHGEQAE